VLLIVNKLKSGLPDGALNYVLSLDGNDCFWSGKIAELADTDVSNHCENDRTRHTANMSRHR